MEKEKHSLNELENLYDYSMQELKREIESGASTDILMRTFEEAENRRKRMRMLAKAETFRQKLGLEFIVVTVAFTLSVICNNDIFTWDWFQQFIAEFIIAEIIVHVAYINATTTMDEYKLSTSFIDYLSNCGTLVLLLLTIWFFSR